ncbi:MAG TPA: hypothetical protein PLW86_06205 [Rhodocyclaceae bacterium]|nr:hypothetical protein [Rhodocyclaceae bacterium]
MRDEITAIVFAAIDELNETLDEKTPLAKEESAIMQGEGAGIDSLDVANLLMFIEDRILAAKGVELDLLDAELMSQSENPYRTVGTTIDTVLRALVAHA